MFQLIQVPDFRDLNLPDGRLAKSLNLHELRRELQRIGVADISPASGMQDLLTAFQQHQAAEKAVADEQRQRARNGHANQGEAIIADIKARARA